MRLILADIGWSQLGRLEGRSYPPYMSDNTGHVIRGMEEVQEGENRNP